MAERNNDPAPKFGDWEDNNVPYSIYFENKKKKKKKKRDQSQKVNANHSGEILDAFSQSSSLEVGPPSYVEPARQRDQFVPTPVRHVARGHGPTRESPLHYQSTSSEPTMRSSQLIPGKGYYSEKSPPHWKAEIPAVPAFGKWNEKDLSVDEDYSGISGDSSREKKSALLNISPQRQEKDKTKEKMPSCSCFDWSWK